MDDFVIGAVGGADPQPVRGDNETEADFQLRVRRYQDQEARRQTMEQEVNNARVQAHAAQQAIADLAATLTHNIQQLPPRRANPDPPPPPPPAPVVREQNRKITPLEKVDPIEWQNWRAMFTMIARVMQWNDLRQRQELFINVQGEAAHVVQDIDPEAPQMTIDDLLTAYESRFVTRGAGDLARMEFSTAKQSDDEEILAYHGRLRSLFKRAYPAADVNAPVEGRMLREKFILGLANPEIRKEVWKAQPGDFAAALTAAENHHATIAMMKMVEEGDRYQRRKGINNLGPTGKGGVLCWLCQERGHIRPDCPKNPNKRASKNKGNNNPPNANRRNNPSINNVGGKGKDKDDRPAENKEVKQPEN